MNPGLKSTLDIWDMQMADYGKKIIEKREEFVEELNELAKGRSENLSLTGLVLTVYHSLVHYF